MKKEESIKKDVRDAYAKIARGQKPSCCGSNNSSCCSQDTSDPGEVAEQLGYSADDVQDVPDNANMGLGCGNPQAIADLKEGETVLDLGCGGGFDCFLAAKQVGESGQVIGVDMTIEMIMKARENGRKCGMTTVDFRIGEIEDLPVGDESVDVIISNCVINLSPNKPKVYEEAYRVLNPGGRLAISDVVVIKEIPQEMKEDFEKYCGCVVGAETPEKLEKILTKAGFKEIAINVNEQSAEFIKNWFPGSGAENYVAAASIQAIKP